MRIQNNPNRILDCIQKRHLAFAAIRQYFSSQDFIEIDSSQLIKANCIETHIDPIAVKVNLGSHENVERYLHTSPEIYHKRLLSYGAQKIYQLGHVFRNGELGRLHSPEFTLLEWYRAHGSLDDLIKDCENLFALMAKALIGQTQITLIDQSIMDLSKPFEKRDMCDLWQQYAAIDLRSILIKMKDGHDLALVELVRKNGMPLRENATFEDVFHHIMMTKIEPMIGTDRPCVILKWPVQMAALAKPCEDDLLFAERFEIYAGQMELANAFQELIDPAEQLRRFQADLLERSKLGKKDLPIHEEFITDLAYMPNAAGIAVGFDRLLMLILGKTSIDHVLAFPWLKN